MAAYYNEIDPHAAQWLRNLIDAGHIARGEVDTRSIWDVHPDDLRSFTQCHFFAGIGIWSDALRRAGWPDDRPVWTGSCPCQPFSAAGKGRGFADDRHLWPAWAHLIRELGPGRIFGEQVEGHDGKAWLDAVQADLEKGGYAVGPVVLPAAGFGAPHGRHRFYFVAESGEQRREGKRLHLRERGSQPHMPQAARSGEARRLADTDGGQSRDGELQPSREHGQQPEDGRAGIVGDTCGSRLAVGSGAEDGRGAVRDEGAAAPQAGPVGGWWADAEWLYCTDERYRAIEPGTFPLVDGAASRLVRLRAYGNAIAAPVAEEFIRAYLAT